VDVSIFAKEYFFIYNGLTGYGFQIQINIALITADFTQITAYL